MMKVPVQQRKRVRFKSLDKTWHRVEVAIELHLSQIEILARQIYLQQIMDNTDVTTRDNGDGTYTHTFTPKR
jgi:hypothetical protein